MSFYQSRAGGSSKEFPSYLSNNKRLSVQLKAIDVQLQKDLKSLARENEVCLRSQQAKELQFRTRYEKYLTRGNLESSLLKKEEFRKTMKEMRKQNDDNNSEEHIPLHKLIYTNGEVDVEKVVCLHLLTVHRIDPALFVKNKNFHLFPRRSKTTVLEASALPFYILEIVHNVNTETYSELKDGQDVIVMVNSNLETLVTSILEVLAIVSPQKLQSIIELSNNKRGIQEIMIKTKIHNFLAQIKEYPALFLTQNYRLEITKYRTEPCVSHNVISLHKIRVKDRSGKLDLIQKEIKLIISKYAELHNESEELWPMFHKKFCECKKPNSKDTSSLGNGISLRLDDGKEFAVVTESGCHLPSDSTQQYSSLTAIIKSSPKPNQYEQTRVSFSTPKGLPTTKNDQKHLMSSIIKNANNTNRILLGKKVAELTSESSADTKKKPKILLDEVIEEVFSTESLILLASNTGNEELKMLFQPPCRGGLGLGSFLLQPEKVKSNKTTPPRLTRMSYQNWQEPVPQLIKQEQAQMDIAKIKHDLFTSETRTKMKQFLQSENPAPKHVLNNTFLKR